MYTQENKSKKNINCHITFQNLNNKTKLYENKNAVPTNNFNAQVGVVPECMEILFILYV